MIQGSKIRAGVAILLAVVWAGCSTGPSKARPIGEAYVGPSTLNLRSDIPLESSTVVTVKHGDRLQILQRRRLFLRVRAPGGKEGWTDERQLLSAADMDAVKDLAEYAAKLPPQGVATVDADLRVHMQPAAKSPSFLTIKEKENVVVLTHLRRERTDIPRPPLVPPPPKKVKAPPKPQKEVKYPPPPVPPPPGPPANWLELSKTDTADDVGQDESPEPGQPPATDDWSLVRTSDGQSGWVLTRRLRMAVPDDVGQYAEGHRIVAYFSLGKVQDGDLTKDIWLWTTIGSAPQPYDFDSFRVFVWSSRRHRYETAHIERNIQGYGPVLLESVEYGASKGKAAVAAFSGFSLCEVDNTGQRVRRRFAVLYPTVRLAGEQPCEVSQPFDPTGAPTPQALAAAEAPAANASWWERVKARMRRWFRR